MCFQEEVSGCEPLLLAQQNLLSKLFWRCELPSLSQLCYQLLPGKQDTVSLELSVPERKKTIFPAVIKKQLEMNAIRWSCSPSQI